MFYFSWQVHSLVHLGMCIAPSPKHKSAFPDYINFCMDTIYTRRLRCLPSNKSWITSYLKELVKIKELSGREIGNYFRQSKNNFKPKLETTRRWTGKTREQAPEKEQTGCVVRDGKNHRLQVEGWSERWKSGQNQWTEHNSFSSETSSLSCPQLKQTSHPGPSSTTSVMDFVAASLLPPTTSGDAGDQFFSPNQ